MNIKLENLKSMNNNDNELVVKTMAYICKIVSLSDKPIFRKL